MSRPFKYTPEQVAQALTDCHGKVYLAAERLGCAAQTVYSYLEQHACVREAAEHAKGRFLDVLEVRLHEKALAGDLAAIKYTLSTQGRTRGYGDPTPSEAIFAWVLAHGCCARLIEGSLSSAKLLPAGAKLLPAGGLLGAGPEVIDAELEG